MLICKTAKLSSENKRPLPAQVLASVLNDWALYELQVQIGEIGVRGRQMSPQVLQEPGLAVGRAG